MEEAWRRVAWLGVAFWYLHALAERRHEIFFGPIHSYCLHLRDWDRRQWKHAWVNRIALFLRKWAAREADGLEEDLFGPLPQPGVVLTHDVDALRKTVALRFKQGAFNIFNCLRFGLQGEFRKSAKCAFSALRFTLGRDEYDQLNLVIDTESRASLTALFHFYARERSRGFSWKRWLFDPAYELGTVEMADRVREVVKKGFSVGLHPSYETWEDATALSLQKRELESVLGRTVSSVRQHWMRFSWADTWAAQVKAGLTSDSTLGFNDRFGFRTGAALRYSPYSARTADFSGFTTLPMILMDSHLYDYAGLKAEERVDAMRMLLKEIVAVGGEAAVLWHPHTLSRDYGWKEGFLQFIKQFQSVLAQTAIQS